MPGSFEKKVQEKMEELKLTPSAPVWEKIEAQIKPEKERRRGLFWFPFLILLLAGTGWWLFGDDEKMPDVTPSTAQAPMNKNSNPAASPRNTVTPATDRINAEKLTGRRKEEKTPATVRRYKKSPSITSKTGESLLPQATGSLPLAKNTGKKNSIRQKADIAISFAQKNKTGDQKNVSGGKAAPGSDQKADQLLTPVQKEQPASVSAITKPAPVQNEKALDQTENAVPVDSPVQSRALADEKQLPPVVVDTIATKRKVASATKKWKLALALQTAWAPPAFGNKSASLARYDANTPANTNSGQQSSGGLFSSSNQPNKISGGAAYALGFGLSRAVSQRLQVSIGVQYASYRFRTRVGAFRPLDTALAFNRSSVAVEGFYRNGSQTDYTVRYSVLEMPVSFSYQLSASLPLHFSTGVVYGRLLKSNALTYDQAARVYYKNSENLNRNFFSLSSSLQYNIISRQDFTLRAGPMVQYQLTDLHKNNNWTPRLFFVGLKTSVQF